MKKLIIFKDAAHPVNAYITTCYKRSCLQFHMSSPCTIIFHGLAILIKWYFIFNKGLKNLSIILLITASRPGYVKEFSQKLKRQTNIGKFTNIKCHWEKNRQITGNQWSLWLIMDIIYGFSTFLSFIRLTVNT